MIITVKRSDILDIGIIALLMAQLMILRWLGVQEMFNYIMFFLLMLSMLININHYKHSVLFLFLSLFIIYPFFNLAILGGTLHFAALNLYRMLRTLLLAIYLCDLIVYKHSFLMSFLRKGFWLFNAYMLLNIVVLLLECRGHYYLAGYNIGSLKGHYPPDLISGTFGRFGTPCLAMYSVFILLYDALYLQYWCCKRYKPLLRRYMFFLLIFDLWVSTQNDNKGFYIILILFVLVYYSCRNSADTRNKYSITRRLRFVWLMLLIILLSYGLFYLFPGIRHVFEQIILKVNQALNNVEDTKGGGERIAMILFALRTPRNAVFGYGLGNYLNRSRTLGFLHFGQSDFGSYLCLGGIVFVTLQYACLYSSFRRNFGKNHISRVMLFLFIILGIYTQPFYNTSTMICCLLIYSVCWTAFELGQENKYLVNDKTAQGKIQIRARRAF